MKKVLWGIALSVTVFVVCGNGFGEEFGQSKSYHGPTGLQLYSLRDMFKKQGAGPTLDLVQKWGFRYVELAAGIPKGMGPTELKAELDKRGLVPIGSHVAYDRLKKDLDGVIKEAKILGLPYVGLAWIPHKGTFDEKQCREAAAFLNQVGKAFAKNGIKFYLHNHGYEFEPYKEGTLFDLLAAETDPKYVSFQMDVLWVVLPGQDPVKLLEKYPDRWVLFHLKDLKKGVALGVLSGHTDLTNDVSIGSGQIDWPAVFTASQKAGVKYYFIEDESPSSVEQVPQSIKFLEHIEW